MCSTLPSAIVRRRAGAVLLLALAFAPAAGPALAWCEDAGATMVETRACLAETREAVEIELALAWTGVQQNIATRYFLRNTQRARFAAAADRAQAAWAAFRAVDCREVTGFEWWGGSGAGAAVSLCMVETAAARVRDLTARYQLDPMEFPLAHGGGR